MQPNPTNHLIWRICAGSILIYYTFGLLGFAGLAGNFPPPELEEPANRGDAPAGAHQREANPPRFS